MKPTRVLVLLLGFLFLFCGRAFAQSTTVTLSVTDAGSQAWASGSYSFQLYPAPQYPNLNTYTWTGGTLAQTINGSLDGSGSASVSIPSNTAISPVGSKWVVQVCPQATSACYSTAATTITGASQSISPVPPAIAINLINPPGPFTTAYSDSEIATTTIGGSYFNLTSGVTRTCTAVSGSACTAWSTSGGGGTVTGVTGTLPIVSSGGAAPVISCPTCDTSAAPLTSGQLLVGAGGQATQVGNLTGDVSTSGSTATTLASVATAGSCGDSTHTCTTTIDVKGRVTSQSPNAIAGGTVTSVGLTMPGYNVANSPVTSSGTLAGSRQDSTIYAVDYGATGDGKWVLDASWTNGASPAAVTCPNNDCNFVAADTGKACFGISSGGTTAFAVGTFTFTSAQAGTCTGTVSGSASATGHFFWGTDATTPLVNATAAVVALQNCGTLVLPNGGLMVTHGIGNAIPSKCWAGPGFGGEMASFNVTGQGRGGTSIIPAPGFDFSQGTFWATAASSGFNYKGFTVNGLGASLTGVSTSPVTGLFTVGNNATAQDIYLVEWAYSASNNPGALTVNGQSDYIIGIQVNSFGNSIINCNGPDINIFSSYAKGGLSIGGSGICYDWGGGYGPVPTNASDIVVSGKFYGYSTYTEGSAAGVTGLDVQSGGNAWLYGASFNAGTPNATSAGIKFRSGSGTVVCSGCTVVGGATNGALQSAAAGAGTFVDAGGNTFTNYVAANFTGKYLLPTVQLSCANNASPAVCGSAPIGAVAIPTGVNPTLTINTTAVTANSIILLNMDESLTIPSTTCNTTLTTLPNPVVTARTAGTSFTITVNATLATNPACVSYKILN